jgi:hypothetical protein
MIKSSFKLLLLGALAFAGQALADNVSDANVSRVGKNIQFVMQVSASGDQTPSNVDWKGTKNPKD